MSGTNGRVSFLYRSDHRMIDKIGEKIYFIPNEKSENLINQKIYCKQ